MNEYNNKFLANVILDLVDGVSNENELVNNFGLSDKQARQIWKIILDLKNN